MKRDEAEILLFIDYNNKIISKNKNVNYIYKLIGWNIYMTSFFGVKDLII